MVSGLSSSRIYKLPEQSLHLFDMVGGSNIRLYTLLQFLHDLLFDNRFIINESLTMIHLLSYYYLVSSTDYDNQLLWSQDGFSDKNTIETQIKKYL